MESWKQSGLVAVVVAFVIVIGSGLQAWSLEHAPEAASAQVLGRDSGGPFEGGPAQLPLDVHAMVARPSYLPGETVEFKLSLKNITNAPVTLHSFPPAVDIIEPLEGGLVYHFPGGSADLTLGTGEETAQAFAWAQVEANGAPTSPGHYALYLNDIRIGDGMMGWRSEMRSPQQETIFIRDPGGELLRTLSPGLTREAGGVRVVLDTVEFGATATIVRLRAIPPGYDFPEGKDDGPVMLPMSILPFQPAASSQVDDGPQKPGGGGGFQPRQHDVQITWTLDPVPASAQVFRFVVTSFGRFEGRWEFTLDLAGPH